MIKQEMSNLEFIINSETLKEKLEIKPPGLFNKKYVVKEGSTFRVSCTFNDENFIGTNHLSWRNENNRKIDGESSSSVFTIGLHEYGTKNKKLSLVFTKIAKRDAGIYKCVGSDSSGRIYQRDIEIIIVGK
ncbi:unnamed protein product [Dracunculus medinensis]|uniref:Ig-like domain-containing protein n=1 Tax=Dracunculus medinensis TaxID=318479 RepID=A0A0N4U3Y3_DRAME|nr:unnamed protein product [Dracunculus medinensis]